MSPNSEAPSASHPNELKTVSPDPRNTSSANKARNRQSSNNSWLSNGQLTPTSTARAHHHRESSLTSLGSAGPASPYTANTSNQNVPGDFSATPEWGYGGGSKPVPEIDFTLHTMEDSTQVSTMERVHKEPKANPDSREMVIVGIDFGTTFSGVSFAYKDDKSEKILNDEIGRTSFPLVHETDNPKYYSITSSRPAGQSKSNIPPSTPADDAIKESKWNSDTISLASRAATWGTRRRSEPVAESDAVADGSFLKKLSIGNSKEREKSRQPVPKADKVGSGKENGLSSIWGRTYSKARDFKRKAIPVVINSKKCLARPDSASDKDIMTEAFANEHNIPVQREEEDKSLFMLGAGNYIKSIGRAYVPFKLFGGGESEEHRWFHVLKKCPVPLIMGMSFLEKIKLYTQNKHLLVDCPQNFGSMPTLKWIGSPRGFVNFKANGKQLVGCADTGSDLDFMSLHCARRLGFKVDTDLSARTRVMLADESVVETVGQVNVSSVELSYFDSFEMSFHVLPGLASDVIFSEDFLDQMDAFNTCAQIKDSEDPYQQRLNTLINLGPIQAFLSRTWTPDVTDTAQQEHDLVIEAEIYRRNKANRTIRKMRDENRAAAARGAEEANKKTFDTGHERCPHCIGERRRTGA